MEKGIKQDNLEFIKQGLAILERQNKESELALTALAGYISGIEAGQNVQSEIAIERVKEGEIK